MSYQYNPLTGQLDLNTKSGGSNPSDGEKVQKIYTASEDISALRMVRAQTPTSVSIADKDLLEDARAMGISINAATTGNDVTVVTFGQVDDASFLFSANDCLFLGDDGAITDIPPTTGHNVPIGFGLGNGSIFIDIDNLTVL